MLTWEKLLNPIRRKDIHDSPESMDTGLTRTEIERDHDRIVFSTPLRRLSDKTQVFPLEENDSIRTRLTHSYEVSNLARSIGVRLAFDHAEETFGPHHERLQVKRSVPSLLAAVGLAHDLGNPPFGHQGEIAIQEWFRETFKKEQEADKEAIEIDDDFLSFDGNAQTFRLLTRLQLLNDDYGLNLTVATLAGLLKYPSVYGSTAKGGFSKHGIFKCDKKVVEDVWEHTGLKEGVRHPLAYVMEACDDIAYSVIDAEDTVKKRYASFYDLMDYLESNAKGDKIVLEVLKSSRKKNSEYKKNLLSSQELNDISMQMFRVKAIAVMIEAATNVFVESIGKMLDETIDEGFELIKNSNSANLCKLLKDFDYRYGFQHKEVLKLELEGNNYLKSILSMLWQAISKDEEPNTPFEKYAFERISENYRRIYEKSDKTFNDKCQLLCDAVSGMTENYLIAAHNELKALENGST